MITCILFFLLICGCIGRTENDSSISVSVSNNFDYNLNLYFDAPSSPHLVGSILPHDSMTIDTFPGHRLFATAGAPDMVPVATIKVNNEKRSYVLKPSSESTCTNSVLIPSSNTTKVRRTGLHPAVKYLDKGRSTSVNARFRSMSSRQIDLYYDGGRGSLSFSATLQMGEDTSSASYEGHNFVYTPHGDSKTILGRHIVSAHQVLYLLEDPEFPPSEDVANLTAAEVAFNADYKNRTGLYWRSYFGKDGPRAPPKLYMWPADEVGQVHTVITNHTQWKCDGPSADCQSSEPMSIDLEVISDQPRAFVIPNFLSHFECDAIIAMGSPKLKRSMVGDASNAAMSDTRSSRNTWVDRSRSRETETITRRVADLLKIDERLLRSSENCEELQVVHYAVGQKYDPHHDWASDNNPNMRYITLLFYLNDMKHANAGGETSFPKGGNGRGIKVHPGKGSAVLFYNLLPDGNADDLSIHEATPVKDGEKWLANYWIWDPKKF